MEIKEILSNLKEEMKTLVTLAKQKSEEVTKLANESKKIVDEAIPKLIGELAKNRKANDEITSQLQKTKETGKELEDLKQKASEIQSQSLTLTNKLLQAVSSLQSNNAQAVSLSGTLTPYIDKGSALASYPFSLGSVSLGSVVASENSIPISNLVASKNMGGYPLEMSVMVSLVL